MSNKIERYLRKNIFNKYKRIVFILYKHKEVKKFLELCKKYNIFVNEKFITWYSGNPFIKKFYNVLEYQDGLDKYNPISEKFEGNLILSGAIINRDSSHLNLRWGYDSLFFGTERKILKNESDYQIEGNKIFTLNEFERIIKKVLNIKLSKQKIENLKI